MTAQRPPVISVFGSSAPKPGDEDYELAREVGRRLAEAGMAIATGGYSGTMAAVSQGAAEAGGHVIGVTSDQIEAFRPGGANEWVTEEIRYKTLRERLSHLVVNNEGIVVLPGGIGTLSELALAWSLIQVGEIERRPLVLVGPLWESTLSAFMTSEYIQPQDRKLLHFAGDPEEAVQQIHKALAQPG